MLVLETNMVIHSDTLICTCRYENIYLAIKVFSFLFPINWLLLDDLC